MVFHHRASSTVILTDLVTNLPELGWSPGALLLRLLGSGAGFRPSRPSRLMVRDRALARDELDRILAWDFDRVVMSHGAVVESGGRELVERAFAGL